MKNNNKGVVVLYFMSGVALTLAGTIGFIRSPETLDSVILVSGLVIMGFGLYRIVVPFKEK